VATLSCVQGNWAAALKLMAVDGLRAPPLTTPASFHVNYLRPVPSDEEVFVASTCENPVECSQVVPNSQRVQVEVRLRPHAARRQQRERERESGPGELTREGAVRSAVYACTRGGSPPAVAWCGGI
jgi:hypothetical protein